MKTNARQTSIDAYDSLDLSTKQKMVFKVLKQGPTSNYEIANSLGWKINCVTGRVDDLRKKGMIREYDKILNSETKKKNTRWAIVKENERGQMELF